MFDRQVYCKVFSYYDQHVIEYNPIADSVFPVRSTAPLPGYLALPYGTRSQGSDSELPAAGIQMKGIQY